MPIVTANLAESIRRLGLDAEGSDYYDDDRNIAPAIESAMRWVAQVATHKEGTTRYKGEAMSELRKARVFLTSSLSRIKIPDDIWTVLSVHPKPTVDPSNPLLVNPSDPLRSAEQPQIVHVSANSSAKRLTIEEWDTNRGNPFQPSNIVQACTDESRKSYGYINPFDYNKDTDDQAGNYENQIEIRPHIPDELVTLFVVNAPPKVTYELSGFSPTTIPFSERLYNLLVDKALNYISRQQGDNTSIYSVTLADIQQLMSVL